MPAFRNLVALATVLCLVVASGCRDREPQERFARDLGTEDGTALLPGVPAFSSLVDDKMLSGQATIVKADDVDLSAPMPARPVDTPVEIAPTETVGEALSALGQAFVAGLTGQAAPEMPTASGGSDAGSPSAAAQELSQDDIDAIQELVAEANAADKELRYDDGIELYCADSRDRIKKLIRLQEEFDASIDALKEALEEKRPGSAKAIEEIMAPMHEPTTVTDLQGTGPDSAKGVTGKGHPKYFVREDGEWREQLPPEFTDAVAEQVAGMFQRLMDEVDVWTDAVLGGTESADQIFQTASTRLKGFAAIFGG